MLAKAAPHRVQSRYECRIEATAVFDDGEFACVVTNISDDGARVLFPEAVALPVGADITLRFPDRGDAIATVRHVTGNVVGVRFAAG